MEYQNVSGFEKEKDNVSSASDASEMIVGHNSLTEVTEKPKENSQMLCSGYIGSHSNGYKEFIENLSDNEFFSKEIANNVKTAVQIENGCKMSESSSTNEVGNVANRSSTAEEEKMEEKLEEPRDNVFPDFESEKISKLSDASKYKDDNGELSSVSCTTSDCDTTFEKSGDSTEHFEECVCQECYEYLAKKEEVLKKLIYLQNKIEAAPVSVCKRETSSQTEVSVDLETPIAKELEVKEEAKEEAVQVSDELANKIVNQVEFYFSDFSLLKNNFLLKHIRRNKEGFMNVKIIARFRKIRALTKDLKVVIQSLEKSTNLELSVDKMKIRRIAPIPDIKETSFGKTVVVFNVASQCENVTELKSLFSKFGPVVYAELMTGSSPSFNAYHRRCLYNNLVLYKSYFGVVEFEKFEDAVKALKDVDSNLPKENRIQVVPLTSQIAKIYQKDRRSSPNYSPRYNRNRRSRSEIRQREVPYDNAYRMNEDRMVRRYYHESSYPDKSVRYPSRDISGKLSSTSVGAAPMYHHPAYEPSRQMRAINGGYSSGYRRGGFSSTSRFMRVR